MLCAIGFIGHSEGGMIAPMVVAGLAGAAIPILYVQLSGGPAAQNVLCNVREDPAIEPPPRA